jgi:tRNA(fMet)-specific endonuclease VapC
VTEPSVLIDTNICIYVLGDADSFAARRLATCSEGSVAASIITYAELLRGLHVGSPKDAHKLAKLFSRVPVLPFDEAAAQAYARLPFRRGSFDRLIAAHALSRGLTLVTNNERHFADVAGLTVENWARP